MPTEIAYTSIASCPHKAYVKFLKRWLPKAIAQVRKPPKEISIVLIGDTKMAALHESFLNVPGTTDVLTFETDHTPKGRITAGEIVICPSYAKREARRRKLDVNHEILLYAVHGVLHLSGYDDRTEAEHKRMHKEEDRILTAIGIGEVFAKTA